MAALAVFSACDNWNIPVKDRMEFYASVVLVSSWAELEALAGGTEGPALLALTNDVVPGPTTITVTRPLTITAFEGTRTIKRTAAFTDELFEVNGGGDLTLGHPQGGTLILDGGAIWNADMSVNTGVTTTIAPLVFVEKARLTIRDGAILRNNENNGINGGGAVYVYAGSGGDAEMTMTGGAISGNKATISNGGGGGVYVESEDPATCSATLTMTGGSIRENIASNGGGVYLYANNTYSSSILTMSGGSINENIASSGDGGGVYVHGNIGGNATLTMRGGAISGNKATSGNGGGVYSTGSGSAELTMSGGLISKNEATSGGGVYVNSGSFTMRGGAISGNTASSAYYGGGVYVTGTAVFEKKPELPATTSGVIYGNDADPAALKNTASPDYPYAGHAVLVDIAPVKYRNATVPEGESLSTNDLTTGWNQ